MRVVVSKAMAARKASLELANVSTEEKNTALLKIASAISKNKKALLRANAKDVGDAERLLKRGRLSRAFLQRLKLNDDKLHGIVGMIESVAKLNDPIGRTLYAEELDHELELYKVSCPLGVVGAIFEARPDVLPQISALCLKSGNAVILKGGKEAKHSNQTLFRIIRDATEKAGIPRGWIQLIEARREVRELLGLDEYLDLLLPRGSKQFVRYIQENTRIPVLGHAEGICHVYVDEHADLKQALEVCYDAKVQYPAVCNAVETLLVHRAIASSFLPRVAERYQDAGVEIRGCERTRRILRGIKRAAERDWRTEYLDLIISIKIVNGIEEAIKHINTYGSKHTDTIITQDWDAARRFMTGVDSSSVMLNASTRFSDGYRYGLGAEVGISTGKVHARGPVGLEGLTTSKFYLLGRGHVVAAYSGPSAKPFTHRPLPKRWSDIVRGLEKRDLDDIVKFKKVVVGGTFDYLHDGHAAILAKAFELGERVLVGICSDEMQLLLQKDSVGIQLLDVRKRALEELLRSRGWIEQAEVVVISDEFGPSLKDTELEAIVASPETRARAEELNRLRVSKGLKPLEIVEIPFVLAKDGEPISSIRVRYGEIDAHGKLLNQSRF